MLQAPRIGIVTPTFRRPRLLRRFLERLLKQDYANWRCVVVHDGADPETGALLASFGSSSDGPIAYIETPQWAGPGDVGVTPRWTGAQWHFRGHGKS